MVDLHELGQRMNAARKKSNLSLEDVAAEVGVAASTIQRYEKGKISRIKLPVIEAIAYALHVDPDWLLQKTDEPYDYELDRDNRLADIPKALFDHLMEIYDNPRYVYEAWEEMEQSAADEAALMAHKNHLKKECEKLGLVVSDSNSPTQQRMQLLARHLEKIPKTTRDRLIDTFEGSIDMYFDAMGIPKEDT